MNLPVKIISLVAGVAIAVAGVFFFRGSKGFDGYGGGVVTMPYTTVKETLPDWTQPESCAECHRQAFEDWKVSHHAAANRGLDMRIDKSLFEDGDEHDEGGERWRMEMVDGQPVYTLVEGFDGSGDIERVRVEGVIGIEPLWQYLVAAEGGRWQTHGVSFDPEQWEWFHVFGAEERRPEEWGHWSGQGMNWNSNCAWCHMTGYRKNYDWRTDSYQSTWIHQAIGCIQCHSGMKQHVGEARAQGELYVAKKQDRHVAMDNCATCHARREELTKNLFQPGDDFEDHFHLTVPSEPGIYYADGQVLEENYVWGSFRHSRMHHANVTCFDCHQPHSMELILPVTNNALCQSCHAGNYEGAPVINPTAHSFHKADSTGNLCVECHMPETTYMQRDPRRDHGFHSPDPLMTKELGIPNACSRCHGDKGLDWNIEWAEKWYGEKLAESRQRKRARLIHAAQGDGEAVEVIDGLVAMMAEEEISGWRATYLELLYPAGADEGVQALMKAALQSEDPRERAAAVTGLTMATGPEVWAGAAGDPSRSVRLQVANGLVALGQPLPEALAGEYEDYLEMNSDRPLGALRLAQWKIMQGDRDAARRLARLAPKFDRANALAWQEAAVVSSQAGDSVQSAELLNEAMARDPTNARTHYYMGLLAAEAQAWREALEYLEEAVSLDPGWARAWYNLALAYTKVGDFDGARRVISEGEQKSGNNPDLDALRQMIGDAE